MRVVRAIVCDPIECKPYLWEDNSRVTLRSLDGDRFVNKYDPQPESQSEKKMTPREERWFRRIVSEMELTARRSNGLWHFYDRSNQLVSDEVGMDESESFRFVEEHLKARLRDEVKKRIATATA